MRIESDSFDSAVELVFGDGFADDDILEGADGNVASGVELGGTLGVDVTQAFLLLIVG